MRHLFLLDPLERLNPAKDTSVALMQAGQRAGLQVWVAQPSDLFSRGAGCSVHARPADLQPMPLVEGAWQVPDPWVRLGEPEALDLTAFGSVWMRKDPPVNEAYLYATHLLDLAERAGVRVINRPSALRAWNEKVGSLRFHGRMAPSLIAADVPTLKAFADEHGEVVLKPLGGRAGQGVVRTSASSPGLRALLELVTQQQQLPVLIQAFLPQVAEGDKRILLVNGEPLGAVNRRPMQGEFRSNLALGGSPEACDLTPVERELCAELAPAFQAEGLFFVGIDVIGGRLSEINVTSPTGIREVERLAAQPLADQVIARLLTDLGAG
ncbi:glutathione synthase [Synechococcus sp. RSCCF101]|uniref:glutathione synthase n=1 Tax=Synechococcus sp. RSCCF101 TaxID=2511069 RepID=UPI0012447D04|nr:glutathione synthase [Synechococcus sp. RSCCF101]QEY32838.1 glutathione synthase [Synechococcus sp. RSCCF101]